MNKKHAKKKKFDWANTIKKIQSGEDFEPQPVLNQRVDSGKKSEAPNVIDRSINSISSYIHSFDMYG
jgi:hypothetical protein